jgi:hypothetical protein
MYSKWPTIGIRCSIWYDARVPLLSFSAFLSQCSYRWPSNILKKRPPWLHLPERCSMVTCQSPLLYLRSLNFYCYSSNMQSCHCLLFRKKKYELSLFCESKYRCRYSYIQVYSLYPYKHLRKTENKSAYLEIDEVTTNASQPMDKSSIPLKEQCY